MSRIINIKKPFMALEEEEDVSFYVGPTDQGGKTYVDVVDNDIVAVHQDANAALELSEQCCEDHTFLEDMAEMVADAAERNEELEDGVVVVLNHVLEKVQMRAGLPRKFVRRIQNLEGYDRITKAKQAKIALEGIMGILKWLGEMIVTIWNKVFGFFKRMFGLSGNATDKAHDKLKDVISKLKSNKELFINPGDISGDKRLFYKSKCELDLYTACFIMDLKIDPDNKDKNKENNDRETLRYSYDSIKAVVAKSKPIIEKAKKLDVLSVLKQLPCLADDKTEAIFRSDTELDLKALKDTIIAEFLNKVFGVKADGALLNYLKNNDTEKTNQYDYRISSPETYDACLAICKEVDKNLVRLEEDDIKITGEQIAKQRVKNTENTIHTLGEDKAKHFQQVSGNVERAISSAIANALAFVGKLAYGISKLATLVADSVNEQFNAKAEK